MRISVETGQWLRLKLEAVSTPKLGSFARRLTPLCHSKFANPMEPLQPV